MKLLIVDDEKQILNGLANGINWESIEIDNILTAENGLSGLEKFKKERPEIILTDIRMAGMNGIELAKNIRKEDKFAKIIILSGYSEFSYAKEAFKAGVVDYLLKPVDIPELLNKVKETKKEIENNLEYRKANLKKIFEKQTELSASEIEFCAKFFKEEFDGFLNIILIEIDLLKENIDENKKIILLSEIKKVLNMYGWKILWDNPAGVVAINKDISESRIENKIERFKSHFRNLNNEMENRLGMTFSFAVSRTGKIEELNKLYQNVENRMQQRFYMYKRSFITEDNDNEKLKKSFFFCDNKLLNHIENFDYEFCSEYITNIFDNLKQQQIIDRNYIIDISGQIINLLLNTFIKMGINVVSISKTNEISFIVPSELFLESYKDWLLDIYNIMIEKGKEKSGKKYSNIVLKATEYIEKHYKNDISLSDVADYVGRSKNYFCHIFKEEMKLSFIDYQNNFRIEKAKSFLRDTDYPIARIAENVGFTDYKYFSKMFKKITNLTPSLYRSSFYKND